MNRCFEKVGKLCVICLATALLVSCAGGAASAPTPVSTTSSLTLTTVVQPTFSPSPPTVTPTAEPAMALDLAAAKPDLGAATALVWLSEERFAVAATGEIALVAAPSSAPAAQAAPTMQSISGVENPLFLTTAPDTFDLAWVSSERMVQYWKDGQMESIAASQSPVTGLAINPDGQTLAYATYQGGVTQVAMGNQQVTQDWKAPAWLSNLSYSPDGQRLGGADLANFTVYIFSLDGNIEKKLEWTDSASAALYGAFFSPDWSKIAWVAGSAVQIMHVDTGEAGPLLNHEDAVSIIAWSPDGKFIAAGSTAAEGDTLTPVVTVWYLSSATVSSTALPQPAPVQGLSFSPDGRSLAVMDVGGQVRVFNLPH